LIFISEFLFFGAIFMQFKLVALAVVAVNLVGCSASHTVMQKRSSDVQTQMSSTVFLDPVSSEKHTVFLQIRNTSDKPELDLAAQVAKGMEARGYRIVPTLEQAHYVVQANVLQVGKSDLKAAEYALNQVLEIQNPIQSTQAVYSMVTDVQISERTGSSKVMLEKKSRSKIHPVSNMKEVTFTEKTNWKRYQTRVVSTSAKVNLKFEKAAPALIAGITRSIVGVF
jgi:hypothetical protein